MEDVEQVRDLGGEQGQAEGVAQHQQEDGGDSIGDRRAEGRQHLLAQQDAERAHATDRNQASRSGVSAMARTPSSRPPSRMATRSATRATSGRMWLLTITV